MKPLALIAAVTLAGCATYHPPHPDRAEIGTPMRMADFELTPLEVVEDSRCAKNVQCVWAGRLRLTARIDFADGGTSERELTLGEAQPVGNGMLKLVDALPAPEAGKPIAPGDYRFGFTYAPNIAQ